MDHVAGYTIANDVSDRDVMFRPGFPMTDFLMTKNRPTYFPVGPYVVPAEFVPDYRALRITLRVNGDVMQDESVDDIIEVGLRDDVAMGVDPHAGDTQALRCIPRPVIVPSMTSPGRSQWLPWCAALPAGEPVSSRSPARSSTTRDV
jgi:hypothetical protein